MSPVISGVSSMATRLVLGELSERYKARTGVAAQIRPMGGVEAAKLVRAGEAMDVVVLASTVMAQLEAEGRLLAGSVRGFTRSGMAVAVPAGAARPDISDEEGLRRAVFAARRIGYSTGPSGDHLIGLCERWGLLPGQADRLLKAPPGVPVGSLVAQGEADLGFQQLSELIHVPGIEVLGPLPPGTQAVTVFSAGIASAAPHPDAARDFIAYLASPETAAVKRHEGMEPADEAA
jgi:molybdate transport system substrate-binding protein